MESCPITVLYDHFLQSKGVCTDNRQIFEGCIFWGIKGPNFNGNNFAEKALEQGALFSVVDEAEKAVNDKIIYVKDSIPALQALANHHRKQFDIPIIGITGSNGKTTTKELIAVVLSRSYNCHFTQGNFNNHIGVPLTILKMPQDTEVAIIEMGANHIGEIAELCEIAEPTHGLITNIGKAHLEGFGGIEGVKKAKSELYNFLAKRKGVGFINFDEPFLSDLSIGLNHRRVYYGQYQNDDEKWLRINHKDSDGQFLKVKFWGDRMDTYEIDTQLIGVYNIPNLATAICLGLYFKVPEKDIVKGISSYLPTSNRSQLLKYKGAEIILDAYNANPTSVELAIRNYDRISAKEKVVILGAMKELGEYEKEEHLKIALLTNSFNFAEVILIGEEYKEAAEKFNFRFFDKVDALKEFISDDFFMEKSILIKGSRSTKLETLFST